MTFPYAPRINLTQKVTVNPIITAGAYSVGQQLGGIITLTGIVRPDGSSLGGSCEIRSITVLDAANQKAAIDFWFFNQSPTLTSTDHQTLAITAANFKAQCIGAVSVGSSYSSNGTLAASSDGLGIGLILQVPLTVANPSNVYAVAVCQGTPTYTSTSDLVFEIGAYID